MRRWQPLALAIAAIVATAAGTAPGDVDIDVTGVRKARGMVHVDLCTRETFLKTCGHAGMAPAVAGTTRVTIRGVPPGRYAAQVYHDANNNSRVDRMIFGIPTEGIGFSNDAPIRLAPPKFADAAFDVRAGMQAITLKLRYF
jgi:uncharacterized protein (DUF2141 family)